MPGLHDAQDAAKLARRILSSFAHPVRVGTHEIFINASIGIAIYPYDGEDIDTLLMHADTAMYKAKEQGGNSYQTYSKSMTTTALQRMTLENDLRRALDRNEFEVHYQPIVDAYTGTVVGAEALLRWRHPELGLLLPSGVHSHRGRERPDRSDGRMDSAERLPAEPGLAGRRAAPDPGRSEPVQPAAEAAADRDGRPRATN